MSGEDPAVTVIIPCLNAEGTIGEAIRSALAQTMPPLEVLVVDDGSRDASVDVAASCGPQVRVLTNPIGGPGAARRIGVAQARGEFISFVDADDTLDATKHAKQLAVLCGRDRYAVVHTDAMTFWSDGRRPPMLRTGGEHAVGRDCTRIIFERNPICGASCMWRRSLVLELGNYDPDLFGTEDFGMSLMASTCCAFIHLAEPLYFIRRHDGNITNRACHMAYVHWLAQERFRQRCPEAFARLPEESVRQHMIEPVLRAAKEAHWRREAHDYHRLLRLARRLAPEDPEIRRMWQKRWVPMGVLRAWDRLGGYARPPAAEVS